MDTFEDLQELRQLPGLSTQNLMRDGYGFAGEGGLENSRPCTDYEVDGCGRTPEARQLHGGLYLSHMEPGNEAILAHMSRGSGYRFAISRKLRFITTWNR